MKKFLIGLNIILLAVTAWKFNMLPDEIPLYYSRPWGDQQIAEIWHIALLPILMNSIYFLNVEVSKRFLHDDEKIAELMSKFTISFVVIFALIYLRIIFLVT